MTTSVVANDAICDPAVTKQLLDVVANSKEQTTRAARVQYVAMQVLDFIMISTAVENSKKKG